MESNFKIVQCRECGAKNRIPSRHEQHTAKCGKCHRPLPLDENIDHQGESYKLRCIACGAKNRMPGEKLNAGAKCGKCGESLQTQELFIPQPVMITDANFDDKVMKSPLPVLLYAWASW